MEYKIRQFVPMFGERTIQTLNKKSDLYSVRNTIAYILKSVRKQGAKITRTYSGQFLELPNIRCFQQYEITYQGTTSSLWISTNRR